MDIISYLPDPIRSQIISALPMKEAVRTQILSGQWRHICYSLSNLEFCQRDFKDVRDFENFVNMMVNLHDGTEVQNFKLTLSSDEMVSSDLVNTLISFSIQQKVQNLVLCSFAPKNLIILPCCFFTCTTLSELSLHTKEDLKWPTHMKFPRLKKLFLQHVKFDDENVANKLFSSSACPVLEALSIIGCQMGGIKTMSVSIATLKYLHLLSVRHINVNLSTAMLRKLSYAHGLLPPNMTSETLSSLREVYLNISVPKNMSKFSSYARTILTGLHNVETLSLCNNFIKNLARDEGLLAHMPASCCSLKTLVLKVESTKYHIQVIVILLRWSPNLQKLRITFEEVRQGHSKIDHMDEYWKSEKLLIGNALKQLKRVDFTGFEGRASEMDILKCLLESASILETMEIGFSSKMKRNSENGKRIMRKCLSVRRVSISPRAKLSFSRSIL